MNRPDPRYEPSQRQLPARLDPRAGRPSPAPSAGPAERGPAQRGPVGPGGPGGPGGRGPGGPGGAGRSGRSGLARLAIGTRVIAAVLAVAVLGMSGWGWYLGRVADASVNRTDAIPTSGNNGHDGAAMNLLLVGNDSRASATPAELAQLNTTANEGTNTDTMILVHVPADGSRASFVSFPRDSYVQIPGHGMDKLNAAYADGYTFDAGDNATEAQKQGAGARLLVQTISQLTGLQIDHYAEVDLLGFFKLSNAVGGVEVNLCAPVQDAYSGVNLPAGRQTIKGTQALAFVRQRHGLPRGDFDRIIRQQTFMAGMIRKLISQNVLLDLGKQRQLVKAAAGALTVDQSLDLLGLASQMQSVTAGSINFQTIPYEGDSTDSKGRYILKLKDQDTLHTFFADLSADPKPTEDTGAAPTSAAPKTVQPSSVKVAVFNGSGVSGLAGQTADELRAKGFTITSTGNADKMDYTATEIRYAAGEQAQAATLAAAVPGATESQVDDLPPGTVQLVIGADFNGIGQAVTAQTTASEPVQGEDARTAADTGCIN